MMTIVIFVECIQLTASTFFVQNDKHVDNIKGGGTHLLDVIASECLRSLIRERSIRVKQIWRQAITYMMFA